MALKHNWQEKLGGFIYFFFFGQKCSFIFAFSSRIYFIPKTILFIFLNEINMHDNIR